MSVDVKPRLTKEQHDILEAHFQQQHKPNTNTKKGFAETLGVPLDKINNWFQNRRAKVKQDFKKSMNAYTMFQNSMMLGHQAVPVHTQFDPPPVVPLSIPHDFYTSATDVSPSSILVESIEMTPTPDMMAVQPQIQHEYNSVLDSINETTQPASMQTLFHSLVNAGYDIQQPSTKSTQPLEKYQGFETSGPQQNFGGEVQFTNSLDFNGNGTFSPVPNGLPVMDSDGMSANTSSSMQPVQTHGSISSDHSPFSGTRSISTSQSSTGVEGMSALTSVYSGWTEEKNNDQFPPSYKQENMDESIGPLDQIPQTSSPLNAAALWQQNHSINGFYQSPEVYNHSNLSTVSVNSSVPERGDSAFANLRHSEFDQNLEFPSATYSRRNSSTSALADSMSHVGIQSQKSADGQFKHPSAASNMSSSIATRRHRPRPPALGAAALRSASYSSGMPSPGTSHSNFNPDQTLRRIRSTGFNRIQKVNSGSTQRSPLIASFTEAANSPKFARHASGSFTVTTPGLSAGNGSLAPPTPLTPNELQRFPPWQPSGVKAPIHGPEHSTPESLPVTWSCDPPALDGGLFYSNTPPPGTPLDQNQVAPGRPRFVNQPIFRDTPPQSAPATQQNFPRTAFPTHSQPIVEQIPVTGYPAMDNHDENFRRPSLQDVSVAPSMLPEAAYAMPMVTSAGDLQMSYPVQFKPDGMQGIPHQQMFPPPQPLHNPMNPAMSNFTSPPDLQVYEYSPPNGSGSKATPMKIQDNRPKVYHFANAGPGDFKH
ncbi:hypothetical protein M501DRAFT_1013771 [Patellaria atrata CBS 101060]|uniref:Homeobox domain-containing protein n=1 Tax=Patellaria atrata CBS 101060 TaxID=1346257 RepID=A0A9P4VSV3_9PEZI|nr:hypothetical protein M501DRAFT_1013771 [Patellaria atrata CBS 101060]